MPEHTPLSWPHRSSSPTSERAAAVRYRTAGLVVGAATALILSVGLTEPASAAIAPPPKPRPNTIPVKPPAQPARVMWPTSGAPAPAVPRIRWQRCEEASQRKLGLTCATVKVPLDYAAPGKASILLNVVRHKATAKKSKGVLFVNPGGPGTSTIEHMEQFLTTLGRPVTSTFDVIGMDPRGVGVDSLAGCWSRTEAPDGVSSFPVTTSEAKKQIARDSFERKACAATGRPIIDHMSTGNVARDMDLIRQAVGDRALSYYGVSYGTVLGATYAAMFPTKVRGIILDGVVDPVDWTTGRGRQSSRIPVSTRTGSGAASDESLRAVFAACKAAGKTRCPHGATIASEWDRLLKALSSGPVTVGDETYTKADTIGAAMANLYSTEEIPSMLDWIHDEYLTVVAKSSPPVSAPRASGAPKLALRRRTPGPLVSPVVAQPDSSRWFDTFKQAGVMCSDSKNPADAMTWHRYATASAKNSWFTPLWTWQSSLCAGWPGSRRDAYVGPFNVRPAHPLLVVGNTHDPATPYANARRVAALSPGARLLTVDTFGHTAADQSPCATKAMQRYLLTGALPPEGLVCKAGKPLF
ncbi:alpha/beta hydrolase [Gephyromycinifex aptenodytis]|uniref:alpha/beta hydrolase n=1 Tax=Gephyromycinifex aptenodytis TaxID=2716227 RepID=UPI0014464669|nr:alpha/beta hydrolase [Gephyromycinifex aptenodytis]